MVPCAASSNSMQPRSIQAEQAEDSVRPHQSSAVPWRVLLVDDDEWTRELWRDILESHEDLQVVGQAADGREAVAMATLHQPDVILMDVALPYLSGVEATLRIKRACPQTVVIGLSGSYAAPVYNAMRTAGAVAFVCKNQILSIHETIMLALGLSREA